mmetsp:Transcript_21984/g.49712  ORF Transcript_21984/g.49712 Transcript_21984/m.49712 type:complete len:219 (-) Transcript_21984:196-852(-)
MRLGGFEQDPAFRFLGAGGAGPVGEGGFVEAGRGEGPYRRVETVLHRQAKDRMAGLLKAFEEAPLEAELGRRRGLDRRWKLPRIAHQYQAGGPVSEWYEAARFDSLCGLVDQNVAKPHPTRRRRVLEGFRPGAAERGEDDARAFEHRGPNPPPVKLQPPPQPEARGQPPAQRVPARPPRRKQSRERSRERSRGGGRSARTKGRRGRRGCRCWQSWQSW